MKRAIVKTLETIGSGSRKFQMLSIINNKFNHSNTFFALSIAVVLVLIGIYSCTPAREAAFVDKNIDFSKYKSLAYYGWSKGSGSLINDSERTQIEKAFGTEFRNRGIEIRTISNEYDLVVSLFLILDKTTNTTAYNSHYGDGLYNGQVGFGSGFGIGYSGTTYKENDYLEGTLIVDVIDAKTKELIWQGIGKGFVDPDPATREKNIPKSVAKIMSTYPLKLKE